jgi:uncharacterized repeat protein (TIGR01451 family)
LLAAAPASAVTPACTAIPNIATAVFALGDAPRTLKSNVASITVDELLDLKLTASASSIAIPRGELTGLSFALTNSGNGREAFLLDGTIDGTDASLEGFALDRDGDGHFDPATDLAIARGAATPLLAPGATVPLLALVRAGNAAATATLTVTARAATGSGRAGSDFAGHGDSGCDAVVGATTAAASTAVALTVGDTVDDSQIALIKSQRIAAPNGGTDPVKGATVTYTIESRFGGTGVVRAARLADPIPPGTVYVPGSLRLDGASLSDAADADKGDFDGTSIRVALGDVPAPVTRTIQFQVTIQ